MGVCEGRSQKKRRETCGTGLRVERGRHWDILATSMSVRQLCSLSCCKRHLCDVTLWMNRSTRRLDLTPPYRVCILAFLMVSYQRHDALRDLVLDCRCTEVQEDKIQEDPTGCKYLSEDIRDYFWHDLGATLGRPLLVVAAAYFGKRK